MSHKQVSLHCIFLSGSGTANRVSFYYMADSFPGIHRKRTFSDLLPSDNLVKGFNSFVAVKVQQSNVYILTPSVTARVLPPYKKRLRSHKCLAE